MACTPGQISDCAGRVAGRLLVAKAQIADALALRRDGDRDDREADDPEHVLDTLLLEAAGDDAGPADLCH
jgi:hypothetical protein